MAQSLGNFLRRCVIVSHRYLGIAISLLVVMWFASGIMMIYSGGMPAITPQQRLDHLAPVDISRVRFSPAQAVERAGLGTRWSGIGDGRVTLLTLLGRPAYRFGEEATVFADTGANMPELSVEQCKTIASGFIAYPEVQLRFIATLTHVDQWTLGMGGRMPLHKFAADDGRGTGIYVQPSSGEVVMLTTRHSRALAWVSAIPHWLYFTALRDRQSAWYQAIVWTSSLACVLAALGLVLLFTQFKRTKPFRIAAAIPYAGWLRWHYITGAVFGVFTLSWAFSGLLSMQPFGWTRSQGLELPSDTFTLGPLDLNAFENIRGEQTASASGSGADQGLQSVCRQSIKEVEFVRVLGDQYYLVRCGPVERHVVSAADFTARSELFNADSLVALIADSFPGVPIIDQQLLTDYDSYYYSREGQAPLPVLRVELGDPAGTWFYLDPRMGRVAAQVDGSARAQRWLYTGLHDLDFPFWYGRRPLWDIGIIALCLGGLASSGIGLFLGFKRLLRLAGRAGAV